MSDYKGAVLLFDAPPAARDLIADKAMGVPRRII